MYTYTNTIYKYILAYDYIVVIYILSNLYITYRQ